MRRVGQAGVTKPLISTPADLIATKAENAAVRKVATGDAIVDLSAARPKRARIRPEG